MTRVINEERRVMEIIHEPEDFSEAFWQLHRDEYFIKYFQQLTNYSKSAFADFLRESLKALCSIAQV